MDNFMYGEIGVENSVFEAGKRYRTRGGWIVTLMANSPYKSPPFFYNSPSFIGIKADGTCCIDWPDADLIPGAIEDGPEIDWKSRAEKAEARIERVRLLIETDLRQHADSDDEFFSVVEVQCEVVAEAAGFRIIPSQPTRVEMGDE